MMNMDTGTPKSDAEWLANYRPDHLYVGPIFSGGGRFLTMVIDTGFEDREVPLTARRKLGVRLTYFPETRKFKELRLNRLEHTNADGWTETGEFRLSRVERDKLASLLEIVTSIDFTSDSKARISLDGLDASTISALFDSADPNEIARAIEESPDIGADIIALRARRDSLREYDELLSTSQAEGVWQAYFERNKWIFGPSFTVQIIKSVANKLEAVTTGSDFKASGKRVDALMQTRAAVSQTVMVEIKTPETPLLGTEYRSGCWAVSREVTGGIIQIQKTAYSFERSFLNVDLKDDTGARSGEVLYTVRPRAFLVVGSLSQIRGFDDKIESFELGRRNLLLPEIITFDELRERIAFLAQSERI